MRRYIFLSVLLIPTLIFSGCIQQGGSSGLGMVIKEFSVHPGKVKGGETFEIRMKARNEGSVNAYNVHAELYNTDLFISGNTLSISCTPAVTCSQSRVLAGDPESGVGGGSLTCVWECEAPLIPEGTSVTFNPMVRLYYAYETHVIKSLTVVSQDELISIQDTGGALPLETISTTGGPIAMDIRTRAPIRFQRHEESVTFPVEVNIRNVGGGTACAASLEGGPDECEDTHNWNKVGLFFPEENLGITWISCSGIDDNQIVELWEGREKSVMCKAIMPLNWGPSGIVQRSLEFMAAYSYFIDAGASVVVEGIY